MTFAEITVHQCKQNTFMVIFSVVACLQVVLASSIIFGFSSLLVIFKDMHLYRSMCFPDGGDAVNNITTTTLGAGKELPNLSCSARDSAFNLPFAIGMILHYLVKIPLGNLVDNFGAKSSQYLGCCMLTLFGVSLAYIEEGKEYLLFLAFIFLSVSSSLLMLCPYQVTNIICTKNRTFFFSVMSGCVEGSTVVFIIFLEVYQSGWSFNNICIAYSIGSSCILMLAGVFLYPTQYVLQCFVEMETIYNVGSSLNDREGCAGDEENSLSVMRSQDFVSSCISSYDMYHEAIQKSLTQIKENERREALFSSLSENMAIQMSQQSINEDDYRIQYVPNRPYGTIVEGSVGYKEDHYSVSQVLHDRYNKKTEEKSNLIPNEKDQILWPFSGASVKEYYFSKLNILATYAICMAMLKNVYFIANLDKYLLPMTDTETATSYIKYFGYVQFGGLLAAPICGLLFRENSSKSIKSKSGRLNAAEDFHEKVKVLIIPGFVFISILILLDALQLVADVRLSIPIFTLFLFGNSLMWCFVYLFYAFLFPAKYYCTLIGLCMGACGICTFLQYPLLILEQRVFHGNQLYVNWLLLFMLCSALVLPFYMLYYLKKLDKVMSQNNEPEKSNKCLIQ